MMPLTMVKTGEENTIKKVGGKEETRNVGNQLKATIKTLSLIHI